MPNRFGRRYDLPARDVQRLMSCIVEHAGPADSRDVERLLGALATLSASSDDATGDAIISFVAPRGTGRLVERALRAMAESDRRDARSHRSRQRRSRVT